MRRLGRGWVRWLVAGAAAFAVFVSARWLFGTIFHVQLYPWIASMLGGALAALILCVWAAKPEQPFVAYASEHGLERDRVGQDPNDQADAGERTYSST